MKTIIESKVIDREDSFFFSRIRFYSSFLKIQPLILRLEFVFTSYPGENSGRSATAFR